MYYQTRTIVAGIATPQDDPVLLPALELASRCNAFLHLVHAPEIPDLRWKISGWGGPAPVAPGDGELHPAEQVFHMGSRDRVDYHAVSAHPAAAILSIAHEVNADLVIVGATRRRPLAGRLFGSTGRRVIREAAAPVLVLSPVAPLDVARVLVPTDLSTDSAVAHEIGLDLVESLFPSGPIDVRSLQVVPDDPSLGPPAASDPLAEFLRARRARRTQVQPVTRNGDPVAQIVEEAQAWGAELIVLGSHGRTGAARILLGSTTEGVLGRTRTSILVVTPGAAERMIVPATIAATDLPALRA